MLIKQVFTKSKLVLFICIKLFISLICTFQELLTKKKQPLHY